MEDELDDKILYQTYISHVKIMSRIAWSVPLKFSHVTFTSHLFRMLKFYILKPEFIIFGALVLLVFMYIQAVDVWSRNIFGRIQYTISRPRLLKSDRLALFGTGDVEKSSWQMKIGCVAAYAVQGRRPKMEDRFVINDNINNTGVALFAVFDGHGGEFAANYAKDKLAQNLFKKVFEIKETIAGKQVADPIQTLCSATRGTAQDSVKTTQNCATNFRKRVSYFCYIWRACETVWNLMKKFQLTIIHKTPSEFAQAQTFSFEGTDTILYPTNLETGY